MQAGEQFGWTRGTNVELKTRETNSSLPDRKKSSNMARREKKEKKHAEEGVKAMLCVVAPWHPQRHGAGSARISGSTAHWVWVPVPCVGLEPGLDWGLCHGGALSVLPFCPALLPCPPAGPWAARAALAAVLRAAPGPCALYPCAPSAAAAGTGNGRRSEAPSARSAAATAGGPRGCVRGPDPAPGPARPGAGAAAARSVRRAGRGTRSGPRAGAQLSHSAAGGRARPAPPARRSHRAGSEPRERRSGSRHGGQGLSLLPVRQEGEFRLGSADGDQPG